MTWNVTNITRVDSCEDIMDGRQAHIRVRLDPGRHDSPTLICSPESARALARMLNRHANFIQPPRKRRR